MKQLTFYLLVSAAMISTVLSYSCKKVGYCENDGSNKNIYYYCLRSSSGVWSAYKYYCPTGQIFTDPPRSCFVAPTTTTTTSKSTTKVTTTTKKTVPSTRTTTDPPTTTIDQPITTTDPPRTIDQPTTTTTTTTTNPTTRTTNPTTTTTTTPDRPTLITGPPATTTNSAATITDPPLTTTTSEKCGLILSITTTTTIRPKCSYPALCSAPGYFRDPFNANEYNHCIYYPWGFMKVSWSCRVGEIFCEDGRTCKQEARCPLNPATCDQ